MSERKVLIVDDEAAIRGLLRMAFEAQGFEVAEADNGAEALSLHDSFSPAAVVIDLIMPGMEGIETIRRLRSLNATLRIVALSGGGSMGFTDYLKYAQQLGADLAMSKPVAIKELVRQVSRLLSEARTGDA
jgi:two-component system response regulator (stage 0 sporulation protein F)